MARSRHEPWTFIHSFPRNLDDLFRPAADDARPASGAEWQPAVDVKEEQDRFVIYADVPGVDPGAIDVRMDHGTLSISGERNTDTARREGFKRVERRRGRFMRRFSLPDSADGDNVSAHCRNGVLEVVIPKQRQVQPRKIAVGE